MVSSFNGLQVILDEESQKTTLSGVGVALKPGKASVTGDNSIPQGIGAQYSWKEWTLGVEKLWGHVLIYPYDPNDNKYDKISSNFDLTGTLLQGFGLVDLKASDGSPFYLGPGRPAQIYFSNTGSQYELGLTWTGF